jgi:hypothetical protein
LNIFETILKKLGLSKMPLLVSSLTQLLNEDLKIQEKLITSFKNHMLRQEGKFESGGSFGISLEGDCHEVEVTPNTEFLATF